MDPDCRTIKVFTLSTRPATGRSRLKWQFRRGSSHWHSLTHISSLSSFFHPYTHLIQSMSQSPPHQPTKQPNPSSPPPLLNNGASQQSTIDNLPPSPDGEVSTARGVGASSPVCLPCTSPSWLTQYPAQILPYRRNGNARYRLNPQPHNQMMPCVSLIHSHPLCLRPPSDGEDRKRTRLFTNIARGHL